MMCVSFKNGMIHKYRAYDMIPTHSFFQVEPLDVFTDSARTQARLFHTTAWRTTNRERNELSEDHKRAWI
jgi:hypothetical protein